MVALIAGGVFLGCAADSGEVVSTDVAPLEQGRCTGANARERRALRVMTINLRRQEDDWERRLPLIAAEIAQRGPDVIGLQEVMIIFGAAERIVERVVQLGGPRYYISEHHKPGLLGWLTGEGIAVMSRWPIVASRTVDLGSMRTAQLARVALPSGATFDLFNTHLENGQTAEKDAVRLVEAQDLMRFVEREDVCNVAFLTGDFNTVPTSAAIEHITAHGFADSYAEVHGAVSAGEGTFPVALRDGAFEQHATMRMDLVLHKQAGGRTAHAVDSLVCFTAPDAGGFHASDHYGVMTTFDSAL